MYSQLVNLSQHYYSKHINKKIIIMITKQQNMQTQNQKRFLIVHIHKYAADLKYFIRSQALQYLEPIGIKQTHYNNHSETQVKRSTSQLLEQTTTYMYFFSKVVDIYFVMRVDLDDSLIIWTVILTQVCPICYSNQSLNYECLISCTYFKSITINNKI